MSVLRLLRRRASRRWSWLAAVVALSLVTVFLQGMSGAIVGGSPSGVESNDGNMTLDNSGKTDWNCFVNSSGFAGNAATPSGCYKTAGAKQVTADASGEITWVNGQKFDTNTPRLETGSVPNKDDFTNVASFSEVNQSTLDTYFYGATIRAVANGNSSGDVEFNQSAGDQITSAGSRTSNDKLMAYDFLNGGTSLSFHVLTWITSRTDASGGNNTGGVTGCYVKTDSPPCWGAKVLIPDSSLFEGQTNQQAITAADNGISNSDLAPEQFAEFGVNLTQALGLGGKCFAFPQLVWETRSSGSSFTSNPEDIEFENAQIQNCGEIKITKQTDPRGVSQVFSYKSNLPQLSTAGGVACPTTAGVQADGSLCLNDGITGGNTVDEKAVPQGSYTVSESAEPSGFTFESLTCSADGTSGSSVVPSSSTSAETASITLQPNGVVTCTYVNQQNIAALSTQVSDAGPVLPGAAVHDTATVTGNQTSQTPSGTVSFYLCAFATGSTSLCDGITNAGTSIGTGTLSGSGAIASADSPDVNTPTSILTAGRYCLRAVWPGDTNYPGTLTEYGATGDAECFTVAKANTSTVTTPNDGSGVAGAESTITLGSTIHDTAVVTGTTAGGSPTGSVTFSICSEIATGTCDGSTAAHTGSPLGSTGVTLVASGDNLTSTATSAGFSPPDVGRYCFGGGYSGSTVYNGSADQSVDECFIVTDTTGIKSGQTWLPNDSGTVTGTHDATLNGTLAAQLYTDATCGSSGGSAVSGQLYTTTVTSAKSATVTTNNTTYRVSATASASWLIHFTSSDPNVTGQSHCESTSLTINN